jgi:hypothetical protein
MAAGVLCLWLGPLATGLSFAVSSRSAESCCRSKKTCCCKTNDGKIGWNAGVPSNPCPRTCAGAPITNEFRFSATLAAARSLEAPAIAWKVPAAREGASRPALQWTRPGRAPPSV